ncbi:MAG: hypothetical protein ACYSR0_12690 [Planctomycetota bacterium]|jgi:hypothetical protein
MPDVEVEIPSDAWMLHSIGPMRSLKKARIYKTKEHALSAVSHIHYKVGEAGLKIHRRISKDIYHVIIYPYFWTNDSRHYLCSTSYYHYLIFKNPTDVTRVKLPSKIPEVEYKIVSAKLLHCLKSKEDGIYYGVPTHESEGEPLLILKVRFKSNVKGWNQSMIDIPMYWHDNNLSIIESVGEQVVRVARLPLYDIEDGEEVELSKPDKIFDISEEGRQKILKGI